jgi:hypothetical protein
MAVEETEEPLERRIRPTRKLEDKARHRRHLRIVEPKDRKISQQGMSTSLAGLGSLFMRGGASAKCGGKGDTLRPRAAAVTIDVRGSRRSTVGRARFARPAALIAARA